MTPLIEVENVSKVFRARSGAHTLLAAGGFANLFRRRRAKVVALQDISFTVEPGEALGIIGANGSGKSTLLKLLAGVTIPTTGRVEVRGRVVSLLELGAGFHPLLTGRENIYLNARILGMTPVEVDQVFDEVVEFSGIDEFIDNPVNTYSSGMFVRLGFAVAVHTNPDLFLVDEVLSVGDEEFQRKCRTRIGELREQGKTIVFVSHDLSIINTLCTRVILLSKGRMISRGSPQETIDFYLRQIGRDIGIHTFSEGALEAILCHGRISLFHNKKEVSAPSGIRMNILCMGQWHESTKADWVVEERRPNGCRARGRMSRLPMTLLWDLRIEDNRLIWQIAFECERDVVIPMINTDLFWPTVFANWIHGDEAGTFPNILPGDLDWTTLVSPDLSCRETAALPKDGSGMPPLLASLEPHMPFLSLVWANSDYVSGSRVLQVAARVPETEATLEAGRHDLMTLELDLGLTADQVRERARAREAERTLTTGALSARFEGGKLRCSYEGTELTSFLHFYSSILIGNLWNDSHNLQWGNPERDGQRLTISGESRRFPFSQRWELEATEEGIAVRIRLEAAEPIDMHEYHASIVLKADYDHWETEHESGPYPPFEPGQGDWRHANRIYAAGRHAKALSSSLPSVTLRVTTDHIPFRMTAINTGFHENARVLQALRTPEAGLLHFEKGEHLYFEGLISVDPNEIRKD